MKTPYFSIIIPTHNRAQRLPKALDSILAQTYKDWECIIVDDASTDNTEQVVLPYLTKDNRFKYIKNKTNQERCNSRNTGIKAAKGEYICFLDSDDYHLPNHLQTFKDGINNYLPAGRHGELRTNEEQKTINDKRQTTNNERRTTNDERKTINDKRKTKNKEQIFLFTNSWNETEDGTRTERVCPDFNSTDPYSYFLRYTVNPQRWCVHNSIFEEVLFDPEVTICEDMDTSLRIVAKGYEIIQLPKRTTVYVAASDSFTHGDPNKANKELFYLNKIFNKPELKSHLQKKETNRLLSMCHFHLVQKAIMEKRRWDFYNHALRSFLLCPKGYNRKTNKILLVNGVYFLPILGLVLKNFKNIIKNEQL